MWVYIHSFSRCSLSNMPTSAKLRENLNVQQFKVIQGRWFWYQSKGRRLCHFLLLYLISKCALAIGRNRVTWRSINLVPQNVFLFVLLWGITKQIKTDVIGHYIGNCFPSVREILPSAFGVGQYFRNIGETISNIVTSTPVTICIIVINSNFGPILHRFWDTATYWLKIAHFSYPYLIRRPGSLSSLSNFMARLSVRKLESWS